MNIFLLILKEKSEHDNKQTTFGMDIARIEMGHTYRYLTDSLRIDSSCTTNIVTRVLARKSFRVFLAQHKLL